MPFGVFVSFLFLSPSQWRDSILSIGMEFNFYGNNNNNNLQIYYEPNQYAKNSRLMETC